MLKKNLVVNEAKKEIVVTKTFEKAARVFGSDEYKQLKEAKMDNPNFKVVIRKASSGDRMKGLTREYMEKYINSHPKTLVVTTEDGTTEENALSLFYTLTGRSEDGSKLEVCEIASYGELKKWFLEIYPEVNSSSKVKAILSAKVAEKNMPSITIKNVA